MSCSTYNINLKQKTEQEAVMTVSAEAVRPVNSLNAGNEVHISSVAFSDQ